MRLWQQAMILAARSRAARNLAQGSPLTRKLSTRFVAGPDARSATERVSQLRSQGFRSSLYYLGEYVDSLDLVEENVMAILQIIREMGASEVDVDVSLDPSQVGYALSDEIGHRNARRIGRAIAEQRGPGRGRLMIDMEDLSYVDKTLDLHARLMGEAIPAAITIQAYLYRSEHDVQRLIAEGASIRLVKGAFVERKDRAWTRRRDIDRNFVRLASLMLSPEAKNRGVHPSFGTHDAAVIDAVRPLLRQHGWDRDSYEFEMLYGVQIPLQRQLVNDAQNVKLYVPFGTEWWPYTVRRIGENPRNAFLILSALRRHDWKGTDR